MKILVVGGSGHIGSRITASLRLNPGFKVSVGGRFPKRYKNGSLVRPDQPETFNATDTFDVVINCTDTFLLAPARLFEYCIRNGKIYVETTADTDAYLSLFECYESMPSKILVTWFHLNNLE